MKPSERAASEPTGLFAIQGARPLTKTPLQPNLVWLGEVADVAYGVMTSPIVASGGMAPIDVQRHALLAAVQRCYVSEDFVRLLGSGPFDIAKIFDELASTTFGLDTVQVEEHSVRGCTVEYGGVAFVGGCDPMRWPFLIARRAELDEAWPTLVRVEADQDGHETASA